MKIFATIVYGAVFLLSLALMVSSYIGNVQPGWSWRADHIAHTFIAMALFSAMLLFLQYRLTDFSWLLLVQCGIVGGLLLASSLYHMFPERSMLLGGLHLLAAAVFTAWNLYKQ